MIETIMTIVIGVVGGAAVGTQAPVAGAMSLRVGGAASSFIVHFGGAIASLALLLTRGGEQISAWRTLPWYMLGCGTFGLILYLSLSHTVPKLGAATALTLVIVGQLLVGVMIDHLGAFGLPAKSIDLNRLMAVVLLLSGAYLMVR